MWGLRGSCWVSGVGGRRWEKGRKVEEGSSRVCGGAGGVMAGDVWIAVMLLGEWGEGGR